MRLGTSPLEARRHEEILCNTSPGACAFAEIDPSHKPSQTVWHARAGPRSDSRSPEPMTQTPLQTNVVPEQVSPPPSGERTRGRRAQLVRPTHHRLLCPALAG